MFAGSPEAKPLRRMTNKETLELDLGKARVRNLNRNITLKEISYRKMLDVRGGRVVYCYHFFSSISTFLRTLAMAEVQAPT
jgi:hypothetical protein